MKLKKVLKIVVAVLVLAFVVMQFIKRPNRTNPPENPADTIEARMSVPADVKAILDRSCADCHSQRTAWPFYTNIAPSSWFTAHHVEEGRAELNISVWGQYEARRQRRKLHEMCQQVETGEMPLASYLIIHRSAKLSPQDVQTLCTWTKAEEAKLQAQVNAQPQSSPAPAQ